MWPIFWILHPYTYSLMEKGQAQYTIDRIEKLAELYKMDITDLLSLNDRIIFQHVTNSTGVGCTENLHVNNNISDEERQLYKDTIARFEKDTERLHKENERLNLLILQLIEKLG